MDRYDALRKLSELRNDGLLNEEEYLRERKRVLKVSMGERLSAVDFTDNMKFKHGEEAKAVWVAMAKVFGLIVCLSLVIALVLVVMSYQ